LKVLEGEDLSQEDEDVLDDVLPKLKAAVEVNEKLGASEKNQLLSDIREIQDKKAEQLINLALKAAYSGI